MSDPAGNLVDKLDVLKEDKPVLYDAKGQPLQRAVGFQAERYGRNEALAKQVEAHRRVNEAIAAKVER